MSDPRSLSTDSLHLIHAQRFHFPDFICILLDGPVTGKLARGCHIQDCHRVPMFRILEKEIMKYINSNTSELMKTVLPRFVSLKDSDPKIPRNVSLFPTHLSLVLCSLFYFYHRLERFFHRVRLEL